MQNTGCTIVSDGWTSIKCHALLNVMIVLLQGEAFTALIDASFVRKFEAYIVGSLLHK